MARRILLLMHSMCTTGAPRVAYDLLHAKPRDWDVRIVSLLGGELKPEFEQIGPVTNDPDACNASTVLGRRLQRLKWRWQVESLRRWQPDLVYTNSVASLPLLDRLHVSESVPTLLHVHELTCSIRRLMIGLPDELLRKPRHYVADSEAVRTALIQEFAVDARRISTVPAFIDTARVELAAREAADVPIEGRRIVGGGGSPIWTKGTEMWLRLAEELRRTVGVEAFKMQWVGPLDNRDGITFRYMVEKLRLDNTVELVGYVDNQYQYYRGFDVFAHTAWEDACPLVVLENMLLGTPVVTFAGSGGSAEEIGDAGIAVEGFDVSAMAKAIVKLWHEPAVYNEMVRAGRERVLEHYSARTTIPLLLGVIDKVLAGQDRANKGPAA
jgi:glycosyltransferase involved in cell wall biosynthesis